MCFIQHFKVFVSFYIYCQTLFLQMKFNDLYMMIFFSGFDQNHNTYVNTNKDTLSYIFKSL